MGRSSIAATILQSFGNKTDIFYLYQLFYSLIYIAFVDNRSEYQGEGGNEARLEALRLQLVILFLMAILYENALEIFFPVCCPKLVRCCKNCCACGSNKHAKRKQMRSKEDLDREVELLIKTETECCITRDRDEDDNDDEKYDKIVDKALRLNQLLPVWNVKDIIIQSEESVSPDVLDNTAELIVLHGYVALFIVVFPLMPLLGVINNFVELFVDKYNLRKTQRPVPTAAGGLGVWTTVLSVFAIVSIYTNLAILTFRTEVIISFLHAMEDFFSDIDQIYWTNEDMNENQVTFFFVSTTFCLFVIIGIRLCIPDMSSKTSDDIARQEICQRELFYISRDFKENKNDRDIDHHHLYR